MKGLDRMSTIDTPTKFHNHDERLAWLGLVAEQVSNAASASAEERAWSKNLATAARILSDNADRFASLSARAESDVFAVSDLVSEFASSIAPIDIRTTWKSEDVQRVLAYLRAAKLNDDLSTDQEAQLDVIESQVKVSGSSAGTRVRGVAEAIEGRPTSVSVQVSDGGHSTMSGNKRQSVDNLTARVATLVSVNKADTYYPTIKAYVTKSCVDGEAQTFTTPNGETVTLTPEFDSED